MDDVAARPTYVIRPGGVTFASRVRELVEYRTLIWFFGRRLLERRYMRTWLGWTWIPLRPVIDVASRVFVFGTVLSVASAEGVPYLVFVLVGMSAWGLFDETVFWATRCLEMNRSLLRRMYVPRLTMLIGSWSLGLVNLAIYSILTAIAVVVFALSEGASYLELSPRLLLAPGGIALLLAVATALGLWLSVLGAQARDVRFGLRYVLGFWFFLTPILYPISQFPENVRFIAYANPATAPIELVKEGILGAGEVTAGSLGACLVFILLVGWGGAWFFNRAETAAMDAL